MTASNLTGVALVTGFATACASFGAQCPEQPDARQIIQRSVEVNATDWKAQPEYSHRECDIKSGQSKTYEVLMLERSPYQRLVAINGRALSADQEQQEKVKLSRETERRRNESAADRQARVSRYESNRAEQHMLMQQMVSAFRFKVTGEEAVSGVECYVLDATPNPSYEPPVQKARVLLGMKGRLWIDKQHYHWVKVQAEVINPVEFGLFVAKVKPGTRFELEQAPVGDVWLPKHFSESVNASVLGVYGMHSREEELYSDYALAAAKLMSIPSSTNALARVAAAAPDTEIAAR